MKKLTEADKKELRRRLIARKEAADAEQPGLVVKKPDPNKKDVAWAAAYLTATEPPPVIRRTD
jgi:hypothetical protein